MQPKKNGYLKRFSCFKEGTKLCLKDGDLARIHECKYRFHILMRNMAEDDSYRGIA